MLYRHGDVLLQLIEALPGAHPRPGTVLARGEVTGHSHRFRDPGTVQLYTAQLGQEGAETYARLSAPSELIHEEHRTLHLPAGVYRVWMQREYSPEAIRRVLD